MVVASARSGRSGVRRPGQPPSRLAAHTPAPSAQQPRDRRRRPGPASPTHCAAVDTLLGAPVAAVAGASPASVPSDAVDVVDDGADRVGTTCGGQRPRRRRPARRARAASDHRSRASDVRAASSRLTANDRTSVSDPSSVNVAPPSSVRNSRRSPASQNVAGLRVRRRRPAGSAVADCAVHPPVPELVGGRGTPRAGDAGHEPAARRPQPQRPAHVTGRPVASTPTARPAWRGIVDAGTWWTRTSSRRWSTSTTRTSGSSPSWSSVVVVDLVVAVAVDVGRRAQRRTGREVTRGVRRGTRLRPGPGCTSSISNEVLVVEQGVVDVAVLRSCRGAVGELVVVRVRA